MGDSIVTDLFDQAYAVKEEQEDLNKRRGAVRSSLRNLRDSGVLTEEQAQEIDELFPPKRRGGGEDNEVDLGGDE